MARTTLASTDGERVEVDSNESADVTITLADTGSDTLAKSSIDTVTATLISANTRCVINDRYKQSIYDANGGTISSAGVVTLGLQPADNVIVDSGTEVAEVESHFLTIEWTWTDASAVTRTGRHEFEVLVRNVGGFCQDAASSDSLVITDAATASVA